MATPPINELPSEFRDGLIAALAGILTFIIRAICNYRNDTLASIAVKTVLAAVVGGLVGLASQGWFTEAQGSFHLAVAGLSGFVSPELLAMVIRKIRKT